ncbi:hypothetical protein HZS38_04390 [Xenorhabdus nematophila]|uniref:Uncharacterized protein n=1 Tax=Xenorhabdus nematophila (strain ATCC 19061 / DSM 3370 / CCUG 14189 / LMG 1036 / NCIMB 9965 / AN6) TaxID=406817 RepID=D3VIZ2_XENNA|nr:hypothetical protein [Xenorhabdus nematophila]CEE90276.1 conserved hypothetical protein [Xenorhabdus nematophila str. Anatoliense]CEF28419.1 conserved hypothetical protein [Xenorhabdus nematophila str. Websteri]AYA39886.1 hypothetical protein D3790_04880 [Xenorhabdus nematophila]KHD28995.1 hypothetical protein LH67_06120 [Xenorhabdus nematophila]MBA0018454.1 hypothetical protein [Xenorhabdus nematophila]
MIVTNSTIYTISVSVNRWSTESGIGDGWIDIQPGDNGYWSRSDSRGYIVSIASAGETISYFALSDSAIVVYENSVQDDGKKIKPATDRYS